ncbi:MAG: hypothetical protein WD267_04720 [Balneolales bacterium]
MIPDKRLSTHPGMILLKEYLEPMGLTQKELANHLEIPIQRVNELYEENEESPLIRPGCFRKH